MEDYTNALLLTVVHLEDEFEIQGHFRMEIWFMAPTEAEKAVMLHYTEEQQDEKENRLRAVISSIYFHFIYNIRMKCIFHLYQHLAGSKVEHKKMVRKLSLRK